MCDAAKLYDYIALVDRASFETLATIPVPGGLPIEAETSEDGRYCFVANRNGNSVSVISYETRKGSAPHPGRGGAAGDDRGGGARRAPQGRRVPEVVARRRKSRSCV